MGSTGSSSAPRARTGRPASAPDLVLPRFALFARVDDPPHRKHTIAECEIVNEHGVALKVTLASNWPRTKWWVSAVYADAPSRASATLVTTSAKRAAEWEAAVRAGRVRIAKT